MEPHTWLEGAGLLGMVKQGGSALSEALLKWGHVGTTVTIALFLWGQYQEGQQWRQAATTTLAVYTEKISRLVEANEAQDKMIAEQMRAMAYRLDQQRDDIRRLQQEMAEHSRDDNRRFQRHEAPQLRR